VLTTLLDADHQGKLRLCLIEQELRVLGETVLIKRKGNLLFYLKCREFPAGGPDHLHGSIGKLARPE
jgi:hypothetical protein